MSSVSKIFPVCAQLAVNDIVNAPSVISTLSQEVFQVIKHPPACSNQFSVMTQIKFPAYSGIQCNMMPFIMGDVNSLPEEYRHYWDLILACNLPKVEIDKVGYLTISETFVEKGSTQRRPGIHVEKHPVGPWGGDGWGGGSSKGSGLYMASNIDKTCRAWNCYVEQPGHMGDCDHLKDQLIEPIDLKANQLVWMTDSCPHEALPQQVSGPRQYFRLVTSHVVRWYKAHSTSNPLVALPEYVKVIAGNKFETRTVQEKN